MQPLYKRVLIKLSGEALGSSGIEPSKIDSTVKEIIDLNRSQLQLALVIGAGNWWRGARGAGQSFERVSSDQMGMLATVMNAIALASYLRDQGIDVMHQSALDIAGFAQPIDIPKAQQALNKQQVVIFSGGIAQPYFSTDTASALRAAQIHAQVILKATQVDGIYDHDPRKNPQAMKIELLTHEQVLERRLNVMDTSAFEICQAAGIEIRVFKQGPGAIKRALTDLEFGSRVVTTCQV